jgi:hypothetical protein
MTKKPHANLPLPLLNNLRRKAAAGSYFGALLRKEGAKQEQNKNRTRTEQEQEQERISI